MGRETTENELLAELQPLYAKSAPKAPPVGRAKAAPEAPLAEGQSRGPLPMAEMIARLKAPPANAPATISARFEMNLQRLEDKIDETKEALQTENRGIAKNQAALNEQNKEILKQNKEILHLLNIQRINEKIARNEALASGQDSGARLPQEGLDWQGSRCNGSRKEGLAAVSEDKDKDQGLSKKEDKDGR